MAALAIDVSRYEEGKPVRESFRRGLEQLIEILTDVQAPSPSDVEDQREMALVDLSTMVGALVLARATKGNAVSNEIMAAARRQLLGDGGVKHAGSTRCHVAWHPRQCAYSAVPLR